MNERTFTVALLPNSREITTILAGQEYFLALADPEDQNACVAFFPPQPTPEGITANLNTARLLAAAPQLLRALEQAVDLLSGDDEADDFLTKLGYLREYVAGKMGNQKDGGTVDLPVFF